MKHFTKLTAVLLAGVMLAGCAGNGGGQSSSKELNAADYETDERLITIVDVPPSPFIEEDLQMYVDLGFTHYVLTEDFATMVENGALSDTYKQAIQNLSDAGLKVWIRNHYNDGDYFLAEEHTGSNYGTPYTITERNITDDFSAFEAVDGFYMADEIFMETLEDDPSTDDDESLHASMDKMLSLVEWKNKYYPDAFWHINHVSNTGWNHWPSDYDYADFINYYVENVLEKLEGNGGKSLCMDHYPLHEGGGVCEDFLYSTIVIGNATRDYNAKVTSDEQKITAGICLQTFQDDSLKLRDITSAEDITLQMYTGMAAGCKLFEYFLYRSYDGLGLHGIVDGSGQKRIYDYVAEANERMKAFEKVVLGFDYQGMTVAHGAQSGEENPFESVAELATDNTGSLSKMVSRYDAIAGYLTKDGQDGYMVVNYTDPEQDLTNVVTLTFTDCTTVLVITEDGSYQQDLVDGGVLRLTLPAGSAAFVIPV